MHKTAMTHGKRFFDTYVTPGADTIIMDVGSLDVNGSLRSVAPKCKYIGVDFAAGAGVDVVITDPYSLPFEDESVDVGVSSSCFEHSEFFWLTFLEILRVLKPTGLLYLNVPSNGLFHRYPVDCWRFYPDSGVALQNWARRNGINATMLESYTGGQATGFWNDFVAVYVKDDRQAGLYPNRIQSGFHDYTNGLIAGSEDFTNHQEFPEDQRGLGAKLRRNVLLPLKGGPS